MQHGVHGPCDLAAFGEAPKISVTQFPSLGGVHFRAISNCALDFGVKHALKAIFERRRVDALLIHTEGLAPVGVEFARANCIPSLVVIHGQNTDAAYLHSAAQKARLGGALAQSDRVILVGEPLRAFFAEYVGKSDHFSVVPNGVTGTSSVAAIFLPNTPVRFVSVCNLQQGKGIDLALRAFAALLDLGLGDWTYTVVGNGPDRHGLESLVSELDMASRVTFTGAVQHAEIDTVLGAADVFVLPSWREAFGIAYLEAMACGLVTVGVEGQGPSQFIRHGYTGFLVPPRDIDGLAKLLREIMTGDRDMLRAIAAAGRAEATANWSWDSHATKLGVEINEAIDAFPARSVSGNAA